MPDTTSNHAAPAALTESPRLPLPEMPSALTARAMSPAGRAVSRADLVYSQLRDDIFEMRLLPGDRITEGAVADRFDVSRTPAREALQRLQSDGLMQGYVRGGWEVVPIDFKRFDDLYEMRELIETFAVRKICSGTGVAAEHLGALLDALDAIWSVPTGKRMKDGRHVAMLDEAFHQALVDATGNGELMSELHRVTDRIRIVRRLDFVYGDCIASTYDEHAAILAAIRQHRADEALALLRSHIEDSHAAVRTLTLHRLHGARTGIVPTAPVRTPSGRRRTI
jgi:DNA-binding GntR family transcriptional regulator